MTHGDRAAALDPAAAAAAVRARLTRRRPPLAVPRRGAAPVQP